MSPKNPRRVTGSPSLKNYIDGSSDGTQVAAAVVHKEEKLIIRLYDSASVLDAEMTAIRVALKDAKIIIIIINITYTPHI